jgi:hypothetical protein
MCGKSRGDTMDNESVKVTLTQRQAQVWARTGEDEEKPVKVLWVRPVSGRGREVSIMGEDNEEIVLLESLDLLDADSRKVAEEALDLRYLVPRITSIPVANPQFGNRYLEVETDRGPRKFLLKDPNSNVVWLTDDRLTIRDTLGNRYEIESLSALDSKSRGNISRVI